MLSEGGPAALSVLSCLVVDELHMVSSWGGACSPVPTGLLVLGHSKQGIEEEDHVYLGQTMADSLRLLLLPHIDCGGSL